MSFARSFAFGAACLFLSLVVAARCAPPPPGFDRAITTERLTGATLTEIGRDPKIIWHFGVKRFRVEFRGDPPVALIRQLLGQEKKVKQIEGLWRYKDQGNQLVLEDLSAGDLKNRQQVILQIDPAGPLRANLDDRQYHLEEFDVRGLWESTAEDAKVSWKFKFEPLIDLGNPLTVQCEKGYLPESLVKSLMGESLKVSKIEGQWEFIPNTKRIKFKKLSAEGHKQNEVVETTAKPVDVLTMELFGSQYRRESAK
jgi:hypothetical protein